MWKLNYIPNWTITENQFKLTNYELYMTLPHCNILSKFCPILVPAGNKQSANHENVLNKKKVQSIFPTSQLFKKAGQCCLNFDLNYPYPYY